MGHFLWRSNARVDLGCFSIEKIRCGGGLWLVSMAKHVGIELQCSHECNQGNCQRQHPLDTRLSLTSSHVHAHTP